MIKYYWLTLLGIYSIRLYYIYFLFYFNYYLGFLNYLNLFSYIKFSNTFEKEV